MVVHPASHKVPRVSWYSGFRPGLFLFRLREFHPLCFTFPDDSAKAFVFSVGPKPRPSEDGRFGLFPFRSPLLRESLLITFPLVT